MPFAAELADVDAGRRDFLAHVQNSLKRRSDGSWLVSDRVNYSDNL
jgi:hypothetical protein